MLQKVSQNFHETEISKENLRLEIYKVAIQQEGNK